MILEYINKNIISACVPILLMLMGVYFTVYLKGFHVFHPLRTIKDMLRKEANGGTSPFRALCLALAGTLGVGNIAGVASAIMIGGAGAVFWMWVSALLAMVLKYAEIVLAMKYRKNDGKTNYGGATYYIKEIFSKLKMKKIGVAVACIFGALCIVNSLTMGCIVQVNALSGAVCGIFDTKPVLVGGIVAVVCYLSLVNDSQRVGKISEIAVPIASVSYIVVAIMAIYVGKDKIFLAFYKIFSQAFDFKSVSGGFIGFLSSRALRMGTMRGLISNEAGCGTAPTAHASSSSKSPYRQGLLGIAEVFVDTILLCTLTALVIIVSGISPRGDDPMRFCMDSFSFLLGEWAGYFIAILVFIFAYATMICWAHYGREALGFFTKKTPVEKLFLGVFCVLSIFGAISSPTLVWDLADLAIGLMTLINLGVLFMARREIREETYIGTKKKRAVKEMFTKIPRKPLDN